MTGVDEWDDDDGRELTPEEAEQLRQQYHNEWFADRLWIAAGGKPGSDMTPEGTIMGILDRIERLERAVTDILTTVVSPAMTLTDFEPPDPPCASSVDPSGQS
jgi:hypothetical protein